MTNRYRLLAIATLLVASAAAGAQVKPQPRDPLAPTSSAESATIAPLHTATICTNDLASSLRLYRDALGMRVAGPIALDSTGRATLARLWGLPTAEAWSLYVVNRPDVEGEVQIRLVVFETPGPAIRSTWNPAEPGPFTLGFPTTDLPALDVEMRKLGFASLAPIERSEMKRPDGTTYGLQEAIYRGPDKVHIVGVSRLDGMPQLGPVNAAGHGGPAYSAQVVSGAEPLLRFYVDALGFEVRSDREWTSGPKTALGMPGATFRFLILYAPGATTGQLLVMDFRDTAAAPSGVAPRPPARGLGMYSFPVRSLDATLARVRAGGYTIVSEPVTCELPGIGKASAASVIAPNGVLVELFERR